MNEFNHYTSGRDGFNHAVRINPAPVELMSHYASACGWGYGALQQVLPLTDCSVVTCPECIAILGQEVAKLTGPDDRSLPADSRISPDPGKYTLQDFEAAFMAWLGRGAPGTTKIIINNRDGAWSALADCLDPNRKVDMPDVPAGEVDVYAWCREMIEGVGGMNMYEEREGAVWPRGERIGAAEWTLQCLANIWSTSGTEAVLKAIVDERIRRSDERCEIDHFLMLLACDEDFKNHLIKAQLHGPLMKKLETADAQTR